MSLFIGTLAFQDQSANYLKEVKLGVLCGSVLAGLLGSAMLLRRSTVRNLSATAAQKLRKSH
jgi:Na+:H+ antiporter, NhaA family